MTDIDGLIERLNAGVIRTGGDDVEDDDGPIELVNIDETEDTMREAATALAELRERLEAAEGENTRLRAALANSDQPCIYCTLSKEDWAKCSHGFPGCSRADDAIGCPELGASLELSRLKALLVKAREGLNDFCDGPILRDTTAKGEFLVKITTNYAKVRRAAALVREIDEVVKS